jgi:TonB-linked SusC/RagA family outer membrane protein
MGSPLKKWLLIMRITSLLLLISALHVHANMYSQNVTLTAKDVPVEKVFQQLKQQTGYSFLWDEQLLPKTQKVSVEVKNANLREALIQALEKLSLAYKVQGKLVYIVKAPEKTMLEMGTAFLPPTPVTLKGRVADSTLRGLEGAAVQLKELKKTTMTDEKGGFVFTNVPEGTYTLEVLLLGYTKQAKTVQVNGTGITVFVMKEAVNNLDETVVQAYGVTSRRLNTGNIEKVKGEDLNKAPVTNALAALQGRVAGVQITQSSGVPGAGFKVQIRGRTQFDKTNSASDEPLYILDGIPLATGNTKVSRIGSAIAGFDATNGGISPFNSINMADIESIEILKDADATAIYGSRGANGVVLITTKKAKGGATRLNITAQSGGSKAPMPDLLSTKEYVAMRLEAFRNDNIVPTASNAYDIKVWDTTRDNNLAKQLIGGTAHFTTAQASLSGGNANAQYLIGGSYSRETDVYPGEMPNTRISSHFNINTRSNNQKFLAQFSGNYTSAVNKTLQTDLASKLNLPPNFLLYDSAGNLAWNEKGITAIDNPLASLLQRYTAKQDNLLANAQLSYRLLNNLVVRTSIGYNDVKVNEVSIQPMAAQNPAKIATNGISQFGNNTFKSWIVEPQAEYNLFAGKSKWNLLAGATLQSQKNDGYNFTVKDYTSDEFLGSLTGTTGTSVSNMASNLSEYKYMAFFGRANYNYDNKYIVNFSGRRDGSSRFGPNYRFSNFGAVGAAWLFSSEDFMKSLPFLSFGKLRASYGTTGNDKIGDYKYLDAYGSNIWGPTYQDAAALIPSGLFKPDLHWERSVKLEFGLELGFVKDRIMVSASWYRNRTSDPLVIYPLALTTGFSSITANLNGVRIDNTGLELNVNTVNIRKRNFEWTTNVNLTLPKTRLKEYPDLAQSSYATQYVIGSPLNIVFIAKYLGVDPKTGLGMVEDKDNSGGFSIAKDGSFMLDTDPDYYGGMTNTFRYKGFTLDFLVQFTRQMGRNWFGSLATQGFGMMPIGGMQNLPHDALNRWQKEGDIARFQKFTTTTSGSATLAGNYASYYSDLSYMDASYFRLKNISLSYMFPAAWTSKAKLSGVRVFVQGQNLFTFTPFKSTDPETTFLNRVPPLRTLTAGFQLTL